MRGNGARVVLPALGVLALVGVVAIASTGSTPGGTGNTRRPADYFLDTFFSLWLVALVPATALLIYGLMQRKAIAEEIASGRHRRRGFGFFLVFAALFAAASYFGILHGYWHPLGADPEGTPLINGRPRSGPVTPGDFENTYQAEFAWLPVLVVIALAGAGLVAWYLSVRRQQAAARRETVAETLADAIDETLDDLRAEPDPRRAVIAAYARLERALAAYGFPRRTSETQEEHLARILGDLDVETRSILRLTDLFTRAKFSQHEVNAEMKDEAIAALVQVRDELRAADWRRREQLTEHAVEARHA
jgi:hypothetical protein